MANTYSQIYLQYVIVVEGRNNLISAEHKSQIYSYIAGIIKTRKHKPILINGTSNHLHILVGFDPEDSVAGLIKEIKRSSTLFINENRWMNWKFSWQKGYGVFSYSHSSLDKVYKYIENQEEHHRIVTFREEYIAFLKAFNIEYNEKYIFEDNFK